jgi:hypothetical protein
MALQAKLVQCGPAQFPLLSEQLSADTLMHQFIVVALHHQGAKGGTGSLRGGAHRNSGHQLDAARYGNVIRTADYSLSGEVDGLLARSTLAINSCARNRFGEASSQDRITRHIQALFSHLRDTTYNNIIYETSVYSGAFNQGSEDLRH